MTSELLGTEFDPVEYAESGMTPDRYKKALQASEYISKIMATGTHKRKFPVFASLGFEKAFVYEAVLKVRRKAERLEDVKKSTGRPNKHLAQLDMDSFDELYNHRQDDRKPIRENLVGRGYEFLDVACLSWRDARSLESWHSLLDSSRAYDPQHVENNLRMVEYIEDRAGITMPVETK
jgi:hypothetical protein